MDIGRYRILGELGKGAMGVVYKALDPAIGRTVAIKTIRLSDVSDSVERERMRDRLFREAQSAGILSHPNIVTIYDILEQDGLAYIFMEYVDGPPLERLLSSNEPPSGGLMLSILRQTAGALDYAHKKGIVHRDIKPANIMLDGEGVAKITDFGVAKVISHQMTLAGTMLGTPSYMSPEHIQGTDVDGRADQWSLAVIAYEIVTGEKPFSGEHLPTLLYKICREEPPPARQLNGTLSPAVDQVVRRAMAKNPVDRYPTCCEFMDDLTRALDQSPGWRPLARGMSLNMETVAVPPPRRPETHEDPGVLPERPVRPAPPSHMVRNLLLALLAFAALGAVLFFIQRSTAPEPHEQKTAQAPPPAQTLDKPSPAVPVPEPPKEMTAQPPRTPAPKPAQSEPVVEPVLAEITTTPPGAEVTIDNNPAFSCKAPCSLALEPGRHVARATLDGHRAASHIFTTPGTTHIDVALEPMAGTLSVVTNPPGATIVLNGNARPEKTPAAIKLRPGKYSLIVRFNNQQSEEDMVDIRDGVISQRSYALQ